MIVGQRVQLHPATDRWMMGDRYGEIARIYKDGRVRVKLDKSGKAITFAAKNVLTLDGHSMAENPLSNNAKIAIGVGAVAALAAVIYAATRPAAAAATPTTPTTPGQIPPTSKNTVITDSPTVIAAQIALARFTRAVGIGSYTTAIPNGKPNDPVFQAGLMGFQVYANAQGGLKAYGASADKLRVDGVLDTDTMVVLVALLAKANNASTQQGGTLPQAPPGGTLPQNTSPQIVTYQSAQGIVTITVVPAIPPNTGAAAAYTFPAGAPMTVVTGSNADDALAQAKVKIDAAAAVQPIIYRGLQIQH